MLVNKISLIFSSTGNQLLKNLKDYMLFFTSHPKEIRAIMIYFKYLDNCLPENQGNTNCIKLFHRF